jgi:hypothetical protein
MKLLAESYEKEGNFQKALENYAHCLKIIFEHPDNKMEGIF